MVLNKGISICGYVVLHTKTKLKIPERLLEKVIITVNFFNAITKYSGSQLPAIFIPNTSCFAFCFPTEAFSKAYPSYRIEIMVRKCDLQLYLFQ